MEELGTHDGHFLDLKDDTYLEFLSAKTWFLSSEIPEVLDLLAKLGAIDPVLWENKIVWCQKFVDNLSEVYARRVVSVPIKPVSVDINSVNDNGNPQSRVEESKLNNTVVDSKESPTPAIKVGKEIFTMSELEYVSEDAPKKKSKYGNRTMALLARKFAQCAGVTITETFDASPWSKPLSAIYNYFDKDADKAMAFMERATAYFKEKGLSYTPHTLHKDLPLIDQWIQGTKKEADVSDRRSL